MTRFAAGTLAASCLFMGLIGVSLELATQIRANHDQTKIITDLRNGNVQSAYDLNQCHISLDKARLNTVSAMFNIRDLRIAGDLQAKTIKLQRGVIRRATEEVILLRELAAIQLTALTQLTEGCK